jgi:hypothetical protein
VLWSVVRWGPRGLRLDLPSNNHCTSIKGTFLQDLDGLLADRDELSIIRNETLIVS